MNHNTPLSKGSTIYDVAELAQVSITTVSRYLNSPDKVNDATSVRIQNAMDRLAYIPHGNSGAGAKRRVGRIGVLTPFFPAPSFVQRLQGMTPVFRRADCEMVIFTVDSYEQLDDTLRSMPFAKRLDGLILLALPLTDRQVSRLLSAGLETVLVESRHPDLCSVEADNVLGGRLAAEHLLHRGYKSFGYIGEDSELPFSLHPSELRWKGFSEALTAEGFPVSGAHVVLGKATAEGGFELAKDLLSRPDRPRALFTYSDLQAAGVLKAARQAGLRVPEDLAILGFDDIEAADYLELSTVSQSLTESGRVAAELLMERIREPGRPQRHIQLTVSVVQRTTT